MPPTRLTDARDFLKRLWRVSIDWFGLKRLIELCSEDVFASLRVVDSWSEVSSEVTRWRFSERIVGVYRGGIVKFKVGNDSGSGFP